MAHSFCASSFQDVIDLYDPGGVRGGLSISQIHSLQHSVLIEPLDYRQLEESFFTLLPSNEMSSPFFPDELFCPIFRVLDVLVDLERRRRLTSQMWWDFCSLDTDGDLSLSQSEALILFKVTLGSRFEEGRWKEFLFSRRFDGPKSISFEEIRPWICGTRMTAGTPWAQKEITAVVLQLRDEEVEEDVEEFWRLRNLVSASRSENKSGFMDGAQRNVFERPSKKTKGAELESDQETHFMAYLIDTKYRLILKSLTGLCTFLDKSGFRSPIQSLLSAAVFSKEQVDLSLFDCLPLDFTLLEVMGEDYGLHCTRENQLLLKGTQYITNGWCAHEVDSMLETEYNSLWKGKSKVSDIINDLKWRYAAEKERLMKDNDSGRSFKKIQLINEIDKLSSHKKVSPLNVFKFNLLEIGLTERYQQFPKWGPNFDASRLLSLGALYLEIHDKPHKDEEIIDPLKDISDPVIRKTREILNAVKLRHEYERGVFIQNLKIIDQDFKKSVETLLFLRHCFHEKFPNFKRDSKKINEMQYLNFNSTSLLQSIIQKGISCFLAIKEKSRSFFSLKEHDHYSSSVADLIQKQIHEEKTILNYCLTLTKTADNDRELQNILIKEKENLESINNILHVVLKLIHYEDTDFDLFKTMNEKYEILRNRFLAHLAKNTKNKTDILELTNKEYLLRCNGDAEGLNDLEKSLTLDHSTNKAIFFLMGQPHISIECSFADNAFGESTQFESVENPCLLIDLIIRSEEEKDMLNLALYSNQRINPVIQSEKIRHFALGLRTHRLANLYEYPQLAIVLGLNERACHMNDSFEIDNRDKERIRHLAKVLLINYVPVSIPDLFLEEMQHTNDENIFNWVLEINDQKHLVEINVIINILMDPSLNELQNITKEMSNSEIVERIEELQLKINQYELMVASQNCIFSKEYHSIIRENLISIFEEASTLQIEIKQRSGLEKSEVVEDIVFNILLLQNCFISELVTNFLFKPIALIKQQGLETLLHQHLLTNVSRVLLQIPQHEESDALRIYDRTREELLLKLLKMQIGEKEWLDLDEKERQNLLTLVRLKEKQLRRQNRFEEMLTMFSNANALEKILQTSKAASSVQLRHRLRDLKQNRKNDSSNNDFQSQFGKLIDELESVSMEENDVNNLIIFDPTKVVDAVLAEMCEAEFNHLTEAERQKHLIQLKVSKRKGEKAYRENIANNMINDLIKDENLIKSSIESVKKKNRAKLVSRLQKFQENNTLKQDLNIDKIWQVLLERHKDEERILSCFLNEELSETEHSDILKKLEKLKEITELWKLEWESLSSLPSNGESLSTTEKEIINQQFVVLKEMVQLSFFLDCQGQENSKLESSKKGEVIYGYLTQLKKLQEAEKNNIQEQLKLLEVKEILQRQFFLQKYPYLNIAELYLSFSMENKERTDEIDNTLTKKYNALKDTIILEGLMKQYTLAEWSRMSEREKQAKILRLKLEEKRLRQQGKDDEAAALYDKLVHESEAAATLLRNCQSEQRRRVQEQLTKRMQLKAEREKQGKDVSNMVLDTLLNVEEGSDEQVLITSKNVLSALDKEYEEERKKILNNLNLQTDRATQERTRQLQLAKLRREEKLLRHQNQVDEACMIFSKAKLDERGKSLSNLSELEKQKQRTLQRITAMKERRKNNIRNIENLNENIDDQILASLDKKQNHELEYVFNLFELIRDNPKLEEIGELPIDEIQMELKLLSQRYDRIKSAKDDNLRHTFLLGVLHKVNEVMKSNRNNKIFDVHILLVNKLQYKQSEEKKALDELIHNASLSREEILQYCLHNESNWSDNLASVIFEPEEIESEPSCDMKETEIQLINEIDAEFKNNMNKIAQTNDPVNYDLEVEKLKLQYESKRLAIHSALKRQKEASERKLKERRAAKEQKGQEAVLLIESLRKEQIKALNSQKYDKEKQKILMEKKLAERKEARKKKLEDSYVEPSKLSNESALQREIMPGNKSISELEEESGFSQGSADTSIVSDLTDTTTEGRRRVKAYKPEETITNENQQAILSQLEREQTKIQMRTMKEIQQTQERLKDRLERLKKQREKKEDIKDEAQIILGLGERQKTMVEQTKKEERDRQITNVKERIEKVRTERTRTMKEKRNQNAAQFKEIVDPGQLEGLSNDEKMQKIAQVIQERMLDQERELKEGKRKIMVPEADEENIEESTSIDEDSTLSLTTIAKGARRSQKDAIKLLNEKRLKKKEERGSHQKTLGDSNDVP